MAELYRASRARRVVDLLIGPWLAILGVAFPCYTLARFSTQARQGIAFLHHGGHEVWIAAMPIFIIVPFLCLYMSICLRVVARSWLDALSTATLTREGSVTHASSRPFAFSVGKSFMAGVVNHLSVDGHLFASLPTRIIKGIQVGERVRVVHTPRVDYVVSVDRLS